MMKKIRKYCALLLALVMTCSLALLPGFAEGNGSSSGSGSGSGSSGSSGVTPITELEITKIIQSGAGSNLPDYSFSFQMVPVDAGDLDDETVGNMQVKAGLPLANPTQTIDVNGSTPLDANGRYQETVTFDIVDLADGEVFTEVGVYRYSITEVIPDTVPGYLTYDESEYLVDLFVSYDADEGYYISGTQYQKVDAETKPATISFTNTFSVSEVKITKIAYDSLNAGDSFEFAIMIPVGGTAITLVQDEVIKAQICNADGSVVEEKDLVVNGADGTADVATYGTHFELSSGQYLLIPSAPVGMCYYVKEIDQNTDGYTTTWVYENSGNFITPVYQTSEDEAVTVKTQINAQVNNAMNQITYTNTREVAPNNGLSVDLVPYVIVMTIAVAGIALFLLKKKNTSR